MRSIRARRAIARILIDSPTGLSSTQIFEKLDRKARHLQRISNSRHISSLLKGAKGVKKVKDGYLQTASSLNADGYNRTYSIVLYEVTDAEALEAWVGGLT